MVELAEHLTPCDDVFTLPGGKWHQELQMCFNEGTALGSWPGDSGFFMVFLCRCSCMRFSSLQQRWQDRAMGSNRLGSISEESIVDIHDIHWVRRGLHEFGDVPRAYIHWLCN